MQGVVQLRRQVADEISEINELILSTSELLKDISPATTHLPAIATVKTSSTGNSSLVHLDAQIRTLEASITMAKQHIMQQTIESRIRENLHELTESLESSRHRFIHTVGEKLKTLQQSLPDLSPLYAMVLSEPEVMDRSIVPASILPKTRTTEELTVIRKTIRETEEQINTLQESIGDALEKILHPNLYTSLVCKLAHVSEQELYKLILEKSHFLRSVSTLYRHGRRLEAAYNKNCMGWSSAVSEHSQSPIERGSDQSLLSDDFLFKDCSKEILERHNALSIKLSQEYIMFSEECFHLSLYMRLFTARVLTIMEQDKLSTVVGFSLSGLAKQVCAAMRSFTSKLSEFPKVDIIHFLNIYIGCANPVVESTGRTYERIKPAFDGLFQSLSLSPNCIGYKALAIDTMLQIFNAKYHIANTLAALKNLPDEELSTTLSSRLLDDHTKISEGLEQARTILLQQYIAYLYASYQADTSLTNVSQIFLFCSDLSEADPSLRISTINDSHKALESCASNSKITKDISAILSMTKSAITNAVCYQYSKTFTVSEHASLAQLLNGGVLNENKLKADAIINIEACLRILKHRDDYFLTSILSMQDFQDQLNIEQSYLTTQAISIKKTLTSIEQEIRQEVPSIGTSKGVISQFYQQFLAWEENFRSAHTLYLTSAASTISVYVHNYLLDCASKLSKSASTLREPLDSKYTELIGVLDSIDALAEETFTKSLFYSDDSITGRLNSIDELYRSVEDEIQGITDFVTECITLIDRALVHIPILEDMIAPEKATLNQNERSMAASLVDSCAHKDLLQTVRDQEVPQLASDTCLAPLLDIPVLSSKLFTHLDVLSTTYMASGAKGLSTLLSQSQEKLSELYAKHDAEIHLEKRERMEQISGHIKKITQIAKEMNLSVRGSASPLRQLNLLLGDALSIANTFVERPLKEKCMLGASISSALTLLN